MKVFVDTAPLMESRLPAPPSWLARQAHEPRLAPPRLVAVSRRHPDHGPDRLTGPRETAAAAAAAASTSARRRPSRRPTSSTRRCIAYLTIEHKGHIARVPRRDRQPRVRLRRLPRGLPVEQVRTGRTRARLKARAETDNPPLADLLALDDALSAPACRHAGQAHRPRPVRPQRADRGRQLGDAGLLPRVELVACLSARARDGGVGAAPARARRARRGARAPSSAARARRRRARRMARGAGSMSRLVVVGLGCSARAIAGALAREGGASPRRHAAEGGRIAALGFEGLVFDGTRPSDELAAALALASHVLVSAPPDDEGDPLLRHHARDLRAAAGLVWVGYLSTIGVYGDRQGPGSTRRRSRGRSPTGPGGGSRRRRPGTSLRAAPECGSRSSGSPASTVRGAAPSTMCAPAPRASSSRGSCSTASTSKTSLRRSLPGRRGAASGRSTTSPTTSRRRHKTWSPTPRISCGCPSAGDPVRGGGSPMAQSFYAESKASATTRQERAGPEVPDLP